MKQSINESVKSLTFIEPASYHLNFHFLISLCLALLFLWLHYTGSASQEARVFLPPVLVGVSIKKSISTEVTTAYISHCNLGFDLILLCLWALLFPAVSEILEPREPPRLHSWPVEKWQRWPSSPSVLSAIRGASSCVICAQRLKEYLGKELLQ